MSQFTKMKLFTGTANPQLGQEIADFLGIALGEVMISRFACGEIYVKYEESIRGVDVFILQPLSYPVNENIMELLIMI
ncbi:MAG TPA: ribose-phosphate pyrophosphokinase, partial [Firmicutes bacterium]|nr:ribose-phosphate pyrophosphokinase [Bacillota bacterium]